jgi:hypothetical protein
VLKKGAHVAAQVVEGTVYGTGVHENTPEASKKSDYRYNNHITLAFELACTEPE